MEVELLQKYHAIAKIEIEAFCYGLTKVKEQRKRKRARKVEAEQVF